MKKFTKILTCSVLSISFLLPLTACGGGTSSKFLEENLIEDQYDNFYEIFVYSFNDTDGDGIGDFKGVTEKLQYVRDMGYTGIWLMPINPTGSYHGYDVKDYMDVNPNYGSMEDFDELVETAHSLGIRVIIDMVFNHSSNQHDWFTEGLNGFILGETAEENKYVDYYNFSWEQKSGYKEYSGAYAEAQFDHSMPDLNLDCEDLRADLKDIIEFWIKTEKVDGFRLDAALHFYEGDDTKSAAFTAWVKDTADAAYREVHPEDKNAETFVVGEVWAGSGNIQNFFKGSHGATFFDFQAAQNGDQFIPESVNLAMHNSNPSPSDAANYFYGSINKIMSKAKGPNGEQYVPTPFLDNHDVGRIAGTLAKEEVRIKFAYGLLSLYTGSNFTYYGDEIGMTGFANDPEKRVGMLWTEDTAGIYPPGAARDPSKYYPFPSVEKQLKDKGSILNYYKLCNNARNAFPALMRGTPERVANANENVLVFTKTYKEETITIAVNFSNKTETVTDLGSALTLKQGICVSGSVKGDGTSLKIPAYGIAILA